MATTTTRIKDIPTTATTAAPDDYFMIDGATNGTRKYAHNADAAAHGRKYISGRPFAPVKLAMRYPLVSTSMVVDGDSTSTGSYPWIDSFLASIGSQNPAFTIKRAAVVSPNVRYSVPVTISTGTSGRRYISAGAYFTYPHATYGNTLTGDFSLEFLFTPYSKYFNDTVLFSKASGTANIGFVVTYSSGTLALKWSNDGSAADYIYNAIATAKVTGYNLDIHNINTGGDSAVPLWGRVVWKAATATAQFYTSTDGATWTKLGNDVVGSGGVSKGIYPSTADYTLGGMATYILPDNSAYLVRFYEVRIYDDSKTGSPFAVFPWLSSWTPAVQNSSKYFYGSPEFLVLNGSVGATEIDWSAATTERLNQIFPITDSLLVVLNKGYNQTTDKPTQYAAKLAAWKTAVTTRVPTASLVLNMQASRHVSTGDAWYVQCEERRHQCEVSFAQSNGLSYIDWHWAHIDAGGLTYPLGVDGYQIADGAHPGSLGNSLLSSLWLQAWERS